MPAAEKILVRGVNWLGDAVMTTPALQRLREAKPAACITLLTHAKLADLWREHPSLDAVLTFAAGDSVFQVARRLRPHRFDTAIVFPNSPRAALETFLAGIPARLGYRRAWRNVFLTRKIDSRPGAITMHKRSSAEVHQRLAANLPRKTFPPAAHHVHEYLHLVGALGASVVPVPPLLRVTEAETRAFRERFALRENVPLFGLNPGAEYGPAKRWPRERFVEAAAQLHQETGCHWILFGGPSDRELTAGIARELSATANPPRVTNVAGETSLRELCAGLRACALLLTNDTGPMHVAAAVGTPVVVPFGSTAAELTGPVSSPAVAHELLIGAAPCAPCFRRECPADFRCMNGLSSASVAAAALRAWQRRLGA